MDVIHLPHLARAGDRTLAWEFADFLPGLETLTPVRGWLRATHCGDFLQVSAQAESIVTLCCDRCLCQYNFPLEIDTQEIILLSETDAPPDGDYSSPEGLEETLPPDGNFHATDWLYEQCCLALPPQQLCRPDCPGIAPPQENLSPSVDARWSALGSLKAQLEANS